MSDFEHDSGLMGAYVLGILEPHEQETVETHLAECEQCRAELAEVQEVERALGELPEEVFLDGPADGGDLLLQRTLRQVRRERAGRTRRRRMAVGAAAAVTTAALLGGGVLIGQATSRGTRVSALPVAVSPVPGTKEASATASGSGARIAARMTPAAGWIRVTATVSGIPAGQRCRLVVVGKDGSRVLAGSWLVSPAGARSGTTLEGSALVAPADVAAITVENTAGRAFVSATL